MIRYTSASSWARRIEPHLSAIFSLAYEEPCEAIYVGRAGSAEASATLSFGVTIPNRFDELVVVAHGINREELSQLFSSILVGMERFSLSYTTYEVKNPSQELRLMFLLYSQGKVHKPLGCCEVVPPKEMGNNELAIIPVFSEESMALQPIRCVMNLVTRNAETPCFQLVLPPPLTRQFCFEYIDGALRMTSDNKKAWSNEAKCSLELGMVDLALKDILSMRVGDTLEIDLSADLTAQLRFEGVTLNHARTRFNNGKLEVEIVQNLITPSVARDHFEQ